MGAEGAQPHGGAEIDGSRRSCLSPSTKGSLRANSSSLQKAPQGHVPALVCTEGKLCTETPVGELRRGQSPPAPWGRSGRQWGGGTAAAPGARVAARSGVPSRIARPVRAPALPSMSPSPGSAGLLGRTDGHERRWGLAGTSACSEQSPAAGPGAGGNRPRRAQGCSAAPRRPDPVRPGSARPRTAGSSRARPERDAEPHPPGRDGTGRVPSGRVWGFPRSPSPPGLQLRQ